MRITAFSDKGVESLKRAVVHKPLDVRDVRDSTSKANLDAVRFETNMDDEDGKDKLQMYSTGIKNDTGASKDKYKTLARRLKEERNQYRETCEEKQ